MKKSIDQHHRIAKIKVIGIGGAGGNAVSRMFDSLPRGVDLIAVNTDVQDLNYAKAKYKIQIGKNLTKGLGTGMNPDLGRQAAEENRTEISEAIAGADMVFITAGFGGGSGTGGAPIVAEAAHELGILTVAVITKPFVFEGVKRMQIAEEGLARLRDRVDALITIPNDRIFSIIDRDTSLIKAFEAVDEILKNSVLGIAELITVPGIINIDFADVKTIMRDSGSAIIGIGVASGPDRSIAAANSALNSPLLEISIDGAKGVLLSIAGHRDLKMSEVNEIAKVIAENVDPNAKIIFGTHYDRKLKKGQIKVAIVATGFNGMLNKNSLFFSLPQPAFPRKGKESERELNLPQTVSEAAQEKTGGEKKTGEDSLWEASQDAKKAGLFDEEVKIVIGGSPKGQEGEAWDIPAFLRRKKRKR